MEPDALFALVNPWYESGVLDEALKPLVQTYYTALTGDLGERCRTCPSYWSDVLHSLRLHLKTLGYQSMDTSNQQYMIRPDVAYLTLHGLPYVYINKGSGRESESAQYLTDAIATALLRAKPDLAEVIVKNPDYKAAPKTSTNPVAKPKVTVAKAAGNQPAKPKEAEPVVTVSDTKTEPEPGPGLDSDTDRSNP